ncbi:hypothetical protein BU24DRAFT_432656 [Aaosphaeria arxii CBS 175.79]|uniref:DUF1279 domain-containing protein n=1 Tax=Aaosphaeria arxii CBS 175.79 TaxID=1450172 RepID=A0A6A5Y035_9PLEO|nr:uncharacterized protein BU24DRAFT_432656 [Aaosphaeria arxii CBS 175.79]KAF2018200.1 hypothetical protein BU24DRAFT_432656 [Aaosphaeria arxii CBS 175.79]
MRPSRSLSEQLLRSVFYPKSSTPRHAALRTFFTSSQAVSKEALSSRLIIQRHHQLTRNQFFRRFRSLRFNSNKHTPSQRPNPTPHLGSPEPALTLSQRLKKLSREYGWTALGVYFALSALDFPFCFLAVRYLGAETVGHYEHIVVEAAQNVIRIVFPNFGKNKGGQEASVSGDVAEATAREAIWTQLTLAYVIHKSFIFIRVPLTAAVLPKVVKTLRNWGWNIGKRKPRAG